MSSRLKKSLAVAAVSAFSLMVHAADNVVEVGSAEDPETGRWIGDVTALTNYLHTYKTSSTTVKLAKGDYDLTGIQMEVEGSEYGKSHLVASGVKIVGMGEKREDVRLIGDGTCRIYRMIADTDAKLENLTITNGYAQAIEGVGKSGHGGGIYGSPTVTNCVITNCKADGSGGGLYGSSKIYVSDILNNFAKSGGGGAFQSYRIINSLVAGNSSGGNGGGIHGNAYGLIAGSTITRNTSGVSVAGSWIARGLDEHLH